MTKVTNDKISILIPVFNGDKFIKKTIDSVLLNKSRLYDLEILVLDNNSTDQTLNILKEFGQKIQVMTNSKTLTPGQNWSMVSSQATGDYSMLICADDLITPGSIEEKFKTMKNDNSLDFVFSKRGVVDNRDRIIRRKIGNGIKTGKYASSEILRMYIKTSSNVIGEPFNVLFKTSVLQNSLPWSDTFPYLLDMSLYFRALKNNRFVYCIDEVQGFFRLHRGSLTFNSSSDTATQFIKFLKLNSLNLGKKDLYNLYVRSYFRSFSRNIFIFVFTLFPSRKKESYYDKN
jgi:glycosyltransferase involved in cell wall biosynthesis